MVVFRHEIEMFRGEIAGQAETGRIARQLSQLQVNALAERSGPDAGRVEALDLPQGPLGFLLGDVELRRQDLAELLQRDGEIAVVVDRIDDGLADHQLALREMLEFQLPVQMLMQRLPALVGEFRHAP